MRPTLLGGCVLLLAACTGSHSQQARPSPPPTSHSQAATTTSPDGLGQARCHPASPIDRWQGLPEVKGTSDQIEMWGLIMAEDASYQVHTNEDVKIVGASLVLVVFSLSPSTRADAHIPSNGAPTRTEAARTRDRARNGEPDISLPSPGAGPSARFAGPHLPASG
jgi:hypothetical protein